MDDLNRSISDHIKSGQYFIDVRKWYANKYIYVVTERSYTAFFLFFFLLSFLILAFFYLQVDPGNGKVTYLININNVDKEYAQIESIDESGINPQANVAKYMLSKYVTVRESYQFNNIANQLSFIQHTSYPAEFSKYISYYSEGNPSSPIELYQNTNEKLVKISRVNLLESSNQVQYAQVFFTATIRNIPTNKSSSDDFVATIGFQIDDIEAVLNKKRDKLNFLVVNYNIQENNQN